MADTEVLPLSAEIIQALESVTTATLTTVLLKKGLRNVWMRGTRPLRTGPAATGRAAPSRCASCRRAKTSRRRRPGARRSRPAPRSRPCRQAASRSSTPWASPMPASSATSCARAWPSAASPALVTDGVVRDLAGRARHRPAGLVPGRRRAALGRRPDLRRLAASRSAAAASPSFPTTWSWSTTTARC